MWFITVKWPVNDALNTTESTSQQKMNPRLLYGTFLVTPGLTLSLTFHSFNVCGIKKSDVESCTLWIICSVYLSNICESADPRPLVCVCVCVSSGQSEPKRGLCETNPTNVLKTLMQCNGHQICHWCTFIKLFTCLSSSNLYNRFNPPQTTWHGPQACCVPQKFIQSLNYEVH